MYSEIALEEMTFQYVPRGFSTFSVVRKAGGKFRQRSFSMDLFVDKIDYYSGVKDQDVYITQNQFFRMNRQKLSVRNLCALFVDLDVYRIARFRKMTLGNWVWYILWFCKEFEIPRPSLISSSGRGIYLKWFLTWTPAKAMPLWDRVQLELVRRFEEFGADMMARDASRVLRLTGSLHQFSGNTVCPIWVNDWSGMSKEPARYNLNAIADLVLPYTRAEYRDWRKKTEEERLHIVSSDRERKNYNPETFFDILREFNSSRARHVYEDLRKLYFLRGWDKTGIPDGERAGFLFWYGNHIALSFAHLDHAREYHEIAYDLKAMAPSHWKIERIHNLLHSVYVRIRQLRMGREWNRHNGRLCSCLYTPSNQRLMDDLSIKDDEVIELDYIYRSDLRPAQRKRKRSENPDSRRNVFDRNCSEASRLRGSGMTVKQIAEEMGLSERVIYKYLKKEKNSLQFGR